MGILLEVNPENIKAAFMGLLIGIAVLSFLYGLYIAGKNTLAGTPEKMPSFLTDVVISIGAVLATNLGAILGITFSSKFAVDQLTPTQWFQISGCGIYILGLLYAAIIWIKVKFETDPEKAVPLIPQLTKTLLGVVVGALAVSLGVK